MQRLLASVLAVALAAPAFAAISNPHVAGDFQGWDPAANAMTETSPGSGIFTATFNLSGRHEFKITDGTWNNSVPGPNSWLVAPAGSAPVTITYDSNTYSDGWLTASDRIGLNVDPGTWTAAGDFEGWNNANPAAAMIADGNGIYHLDVYAAPGNYNWKAVDTGSWDSISMDARSVNTANTPFTLAAGQYAHLQVNALAGTVRTDILAIPEPASLGIAGLGLLSLAARRRRA